MKAHNLLCHLFPLNPLKSKDTVKG